MAKFNIFALVICLTLSVSLAQITNPFLSTPLTNNRISTFGTASTIKAAPDQSMVVVGYTNGTVAAYSMLGTYMYQFSGPSTQIRQLVWVPNIGPMSLDVSGMVYVWYKNGSQFTSLSFGSSVVGMAVATSFTGVNYAGFVSGISVVEYGFGPFGFINPRTYTPPNGYTFLAPIMYSAGYGSLFVNAFANSNSNYQLYAYSCSTGKFYR
jgi:hypothetical protein